MGRKKPVFEISSEEKEKYEYAAVFFGEEVIILGSDSLKNLKKEVKERKWGF